MIAGEAPAIVIEVPLEGAPRVRFETLVESEELRLKDWVKANDGLAELLLLALDLEQKMWVPDA